jgi:Uma2 family endonuclease
VTGTKAAGGIVYPDSDGKRMAENTLQYRWIVTIQGNLDLLFREDPAVFVAGDNLIYPVKGKPAICTAPDVYVAFGRPKGYRGSYKVWDEGGTFPQVIFEVLSPGNTAREMALKRTFYRQYGAEEYYVIDPDTGAVDAAVRQKKKFADVDDITSFVSPRLGIRFDTTGSELAVLGPTGERFLSFVELGELAIHERQRAATEKRRADTQKRRADRADAAAEAERERAKVAEDQAKVAEERAKALAKKLRELGIDPDSVTPA